MGKVEEQWNEYVGKARTNHPEIEHIEQFAKMIYYVGMMDGFNLMVEHNGDNESVMEIFDEVMSFLASIFSTIPSDDTK